MSGVENQAARSKASSLFSKAVELLEQIDRDSFPSDTSEDIRILLIQVLDKLRDSGVVAPADPILLYQKALGLQSFVSLLSNSSVEHISWPLVGHCDQMWEMFFGNVGPRIFYSTTQAHNYTIFSFSGHLRSFLEGVIPKIEIDALLRDREFYCLQLASAEDENLPLSAIIGHEFGHALFDKYSQELNEILETNFINHSKKLLESLFTGTPGLLLEERSQLHSLLVGIFKRFAEELFCDLIGILLMGPAFLMALQEMSWGVSKALFEIELSPRIALIPAYPSFQFRLSCLREASNLESFCKEMRKSGNDDLNIILDFLLSSVKELKMDRVLVKPSGNSVASQIQKCLANNLDVTKNILEETLKDFEEKIRKLCLNSDEPVSSANVIALHERFECHILPNIIPNDTLLGEPARFVDILNAASLERLRVLSKYSEGDESGKLIGVVERLTAKSLEVSFIQKEYFEWEQTGNKR